VADVVDVVDVVDVADVVEKREFYPTRLYLGFQGAV